MNEDIAQKAAGCILATKMPHNPQNLTEEIICDADTYHFGTKEFKTTNKNVKKEYELRGYAHFIHNWNENAIALLQRHQYFTNYCKSLLEEGKKKILPVYRIKFSKLKMKWLRKVKDKNAKKKVLQHQKLIRTAQKFYRQNKTAAC